MIFSGPRGTGKTSTARIFAKTLRCQHQKDLIPCEKCGDCLTVQSGHCLDVMEIDGASNNGVDAIRELRDTVNYMPASGSYKIYIIDEAHMLSNSAFNALLKTLEEPPAHVIFIMATTAPNKIPRTVASRCQKLDFHLISPRPLKEQLEKICRGENISIDEGALWLVSRQARGSLRDGQSLLDQMVNFCGDKITSDQIAEALGLTDPQLIFDILAALVQRSEKQMLRNIHAFALKGGEPEILFQNLMEHVRDLLILKLNPKNNPPLVQASEMETDRLSRLGREASYEDLHLIFDMLLKAERDLAFCHDRHIALEALLLRLSQAPRVESIIPLGLSDISPLKEKGAFSEGGGGGSSGETASSTSGPLHKSAGEKAQTVSQKTTPAPQPVSSDKSRPSLAEEDSGRRGEERSGSLSSSLSGREDEGPRAGRKSHQKVCPPSSLPEREGEGSDQGRQNPAGPPPSLSGRGGEGAAKTEMSVQPVSGPSFPSGREGEGAEDSPPAVFSGNNVNKKTAPSDSAVSPPVVPKERWFDFIDFLKTQDPHLAGLVGGLSLGGRTEGAVTLLLPANISFFRQVTEPETHKRLEGFLNAFMKSERPLKIQFGDSKSAVSSFREEKREIEEKALHGRAEGHIFVQKVNRIFNGRIKSVVKTEQDTN